MNIHIYHHDTGAQKEIARLYRLMEGIMSKMDDLKASVERERSANASAVTLLQGLSDQMKTLRSQPDPTAGIDDLIKQIDANTDALAAAVTANTPADQGSGQTPPSNPA